MPTLAEYQSSAGARVSADVQRFSRGILTLLVGFSVQSTHMLLVSGKRGYLSRERWRRAVVEASLSWAGWLALCAIGGPPTLAFGFLIPMAIANAIVIAHILTNHGLSPTGDGGDTLESSLTVTLPRVLSFFTLDFGYHVEHHLFPAMSHRHGRLVSELLRARYPERYRSLPLSQALIRVMLAPRVYLDPHTLVDPRTGLVARVFAEASVEPAAPQGNPGGAAAPEKDEGFCDPSTERSRVVVRGELVATAAGEGAEHPPRPVLLSSRP